MSVLSFDKIELHWIKLYLKLQSNFVLEVWFSIYNCVLMLHFFITGFALICARTCYKVVASSKGPALPKSYVH